jgi:hypothetical protein
VAAVADWGAFHMTPCTTVHSPQVRHPSFHNAHFYSLLQRHNAALVQADTAGSFPFFSTITADWLYVRLHGSSELYASGYSQAQLDEWARCIQSWRQCPVGQDAGQLPAAIARLPWPPPEAADGGSAAADSAATVAATGSVQDVSGNAERAADGSGAGDGKKPRTRGHKAVGTARGDDDSTQDAAPAVAETSKSAALAQASAAQAVGVQREEQLPGGFASAHSDTAGPGMPVFVYFDNDARGHAPADAMCLLQRLCPIEAAALPSTEALLQQLGVKAGSRASAAGGRKRKKSVLGEAGAETG